MKPSVPRLLAACCALLLAGSSGAAGTTGGFAAAKARGKLVVGLAYVPLEHAAGVKFRTPESIDSSLAFDVAQRLGLPLRTVEAGAAGRARLLADGKVDAVLAALAADDPLRRTARIVPTGYATSMLAIMRTDTDIKSWEQLRGRKVCLAEGGLYRGLLAARHGAIEMPFKAPADSLMALRTGACDAAVHDSALLDELLKLPEWKKFSARLPLAAPRTELVFVLPAGADSSAAALGQISAAWRNNGHIKTRVNQAARSIAFEVYLDQEVPDCH